MWWKRAAVTILIAASSVLIAPMPALAALGTFRAPVTVIPACTSGDYPPAQVDASAGADGAVRGFAYCPAAGTLIYFRYHNGVVIRSATPYVGGTMAVAWDGVNSLYVVYNQGHYLKIGKYNESSGTFAAPSVLSRDFWHFGDGPAPSADVVASRGKWWVVWSEQVGQAIFLSNAGPRTPTPADSLELYQTQLFQMRTLNGPLGKTQITHTSDLISDVNPSLAYWNGRLSIVWSRQSTFGSGSFIRFATTTGGGFSASTFSSSPLGLDDAAQVAVDGGRTYVSFMRSGTVVEKDNATGPWITKVFTSPGVNSESTPSLAVSSGKVFVAWTRSLTYRVFVAERTGTTWSGGTVTGECCLSQSLVAVGGKATTIYLDGPNQYATAPLLLRTQA